MNKIRLLCLCMLFFLCSAAQKKELAVQLNEMTQKGDYAILEVRLNKEDEFRTIEGSSSSLTRISLFTGENEGKEVLSKTFEGVNSIVGLLNKLKRSGWRIDHVYSMDGESLIITHYILQRRK